MKTKLQKQEQIKNTEKTFLAHETVVIADFTGLSTNELTFLRKTLKAVGMMFSVVKKRLLKIALEKNGVIFDRVQFPGQTGVVFSPKDVHETASTLYKFAKEKNKKEEIFKIIGGFTVKDHIYISGSEIKKIGALPSREVLLGQLVGMLVVPIKKILFVLDQKSKMVEKV